MGKVLWHTPLSLDGFIAGPDDDMGWVFDVDGGAPIRLEAISSHVEGETTVLRYAVPKTPGG